MFAKKEETTQQESFKIVGIARKPSRRRSWANRNTAQSSKKTDKRNESGEKRESEANSRDAASTKEQTPLVDGSGPFFGGGDKRQKKVVYKEFTENPGANLTVIVEAIPEPRNDQDVVIKVLVSKFPPESCTAFDVLFDLTCVSGVNRILHGLHDP
jgi:hypothetical protein